MTLAELCEIEHAPDHDRLIVLAAIDRELTYARVQQERALSWTRQENHHRAHQCCRAVQVAHDRIKQLASALA